MATKAQATAAKPAPVPRIKYSEPLAEQICAHISAGMSLHSVSQQEGMPGVSTMFEWFAREPRFAEMYARAKSVQADMLAEQMLEIADDMADDPNSRRIRVDTRKWLAAKLRPRKYGEFQQMEITGADGGPVQTSIAISFVDAPKQTPASEIRPMLALPEPNG